MLKVELNKKNYKLFIDFVSKTCDYMSLVFEKDASDDNQYIFQEEFLLILESMIEKEPVVVHPNTGSCFENAEILYFKINNSVISFLKQADDIYDWNGKILPEELCFYREDSVWFTCVFHERLLYIYNESSLDLSFLKNNNIVFFYEV